MIIQCEQCETTYRFDSAQLLNGEAQVRCIRCGNVFTLDSLSDLGETFLNPEAAAKTPKREDPEGHPFSVTADAAQEQSTDTPAPHADFSLDMPEDEDQEEDFWTSPAAEFGLDTHTAETDAAQPPAFYGDESDNTTDSDANEFIFEPVKEEASIPDTAEQGEDLPTEESTPAPSPGGPKKKKTKSKKKGSNLLLIALLIVLVGAGIYAYYFVAHGVTSVPQLIQKTEEQINQLLNPQPEPTGPSISIRSGDNFYISNDELGSLFVINGSVTNVSNQPQGEIAVEATLYASDGTPLKNIKTFCGNPITKEELRSESLESLRERMGNRLGAGLSNVSVQPGESIPFCAVFHNLPENFAEFGISEAEASAPSTN
jgi:predicted Zn finger-like uncharacterized protein